jgi:hypothetical protein
VSEVAVSEGAAGEAGAGEGAARAEPRHAKRFRIFYGVLFGIGVFAIALAVAFVATSTDSETGGPAWSLFKPTSDDIDTGASQIAAHVAREYRNPSGSQMVAVTGGPLKVQDTPIRIVVRKSSTDGGDIVLLPGTSGALYRMCGLGTNCAMASGKPTLERGLLLHRAALELALYSFHDLRDVDNVVVFMPPRAGKNPNVALHFSRDQVAGQLSRPLSETLLPFAPGLDTIDVAPDTPTVKSLTVSNVFPFKLTAGNQDTNAFLVLSAPSATG